MTWMPMQTFDETIDTFERAVEYVASKIEPDTISSPGFHFSGGMSVRNTLGLWDKQSPLYKHMLARFGLCHADDTGALITSAADAKINGREYDPAPDVARFKDHWRRFNRDPATMECLTDDEPTGYTILIEN